MRTQMEPGEPIGGSRRTQEGTKVPRMTQENSGGARKAQAELLGALGGPSG